MSTPLEIREATEEDRAAIEQWAMFRLTRDPIYVGSLAGVLVAYLLYWPDFSSRAVLHIQYLEVHPAHRLSGYGRALVRYLQQRPDVGLLVAEYVQWDSVDFWRKVGFEPDGEEVWVPGVDEHAGNFVWPR